MSKPLLKPERVYLVRLLEYQHAMLTAPANPVIEAFVKSDRADASSRAYYERQEKARAKKAAMVASILSKL